MFHDGSHTDLMPIKRTNSGTRKPAPAEGEKEKLARQIREIELEKARLSREHEATLVRLANLPREMEARRKQQIEAYQLNVMTSVAGDASIRRPRVRKGPSRPTFREQRRAVMQFVILCILLAGLVALMVRSAILFWR